jgi:septum formation protein
MEIVLASQSPRRAELLRRLGLSFRVRVSDVNEDSPETDPERLVEQLAVAKAQAVRQLEPSAMIIAADTTVAMDGIILNKPKDLAENAAFIRQLSGQWHQVYSGVAIIGPDGRLGSASEQTWVHFRTLSDQEIAGYVATGEGMDKAGGYGIQERGMALVSGIEGDYFNVVGLPIARLLLLARGLGLELLPWAEAGAS